MSSVRILLVLFLFYSGGSAWGADGFRLKNRDHQLHIAASYGIALTSTLLLENEADMRRLPAVLWASVFTILLGTAKELLIDDQYSSGDQTANLIGTAA